MNTLKNIGALATSIALASSISMGMTQSAMASEPFIGEIKMVGFNFPPRGYAFTDGQILSISENTALFSLLGTTFGGDGRSTFGLPDLRSRVAVHPGTGAGLSTYQWGEEFGIERVTLTANQMPSHSHTASTNVTSITATLNGTNARGDSATPEANALASKSRTNIYSSTAPDVAMHTGSITATAEATTTVNNEGGSQGHENRMPLLGIYHIIALQGLYPSRN
jgi:microcystin-dependent protein